tara:strand:- start:228 stop:632 length:405 start_codon:yes stop_codon:yes gene_type:complete
MIKRRKKLQARLELAPIIDIVFILLIFFAVSTTLLTNKQGIKLDLPTAESTEKNPKGIVLSVDSNQAVYIEEEAIPFENLQLHLNALIKTDPSLQVILNIDQSITYDYVIKVLDQVKLAGCYNIALQAEKKIIQ